MLCEIQKKNLRVRGERFLSIAMGDHCTIGVVSSDDELKRLYRATGKSLLTAPMMGYDQS